MEVKANDIKAGQIWKDEVGYKLMVMKFCGQLALVNLDYASVETNPDSGSSNVGMYVESEIANYFNEYDFTLTKFRSDYFEVK